MTDLKLEECIISHEGIKKSVYRDSRGYWTIGVGFLCDPAFNAGLSVDECMLILRSRIANLEKQLNQYDWFKTQDDVRKGVLVELSYNMGIEGLLKFVNFLDGMQKKQYLLAAKELLNSLWATQVSKARVNNILERVKTGRYS